MENNQTTQQESSDSSCSTLGQSKHEQKKLASSNFLLDLIKRCPWLLWLGVAAFLFTTIYVSLVSITQTGFVKEEKPTPVVTQKPAATQTDNSVPLWLLGVGIVGGCAGAIAIAKRLPSSSYSQQLGRFGTTTKALSSRHVQLQAGHLPSLPPVASSEVTQTVPTISVHWQENQPPASPEPILSEETIVIVLDQQLDLEESAEQLLADEEILTFSIERSPFLVQDAQENHPWATSTQSLAEMLDLRRKIPLSTILGENFQLGGKN